MNNSQIPTKEIKTVIAWMQAQMYGEERTIWASGNEYDRMFDATSFLASLLPEEED